jgi:transposase
MEVTFVTWPIYSILRKGKARVVVADSMKVKAIAWARIKSDKVDARVLAHLLRVDFIPEVRMPDQKHWDLRQLISHREGLSKRRAKVKAHAISLLHQNLIDSPYAEKFCIRGIKWLRELSLPQVDRFRMDQNLDTLEFIEAQIKKVDELLVQNAKSDPRISLLMTIPGFGLVVATGFIALIEDINRFENPNQLSSYFGLVPRLIQSGEKCIHGRITKCGAGYARWLAVEAAQAMIVSQSPLTATYWRIKKKKNAQVATIALARKITVLVWHMLKKNESYRYGRSASQLKRKLQAIHPELRDVTQRRAAEASPFELFGVAGIPVPGEATPSEKRAAIRNRGLVTREKNKKKALGAQNMEGESHITSNI